MSRESCPDGLEIRIRSRLTTLYVLGFLLVIGGCATLPKSVPIQGDEADRVRQEFKVMLSDQGRCPPAIDADISVTVDNLLWSGTFSGYLRAMAPAYLRFEGVNPLGLTEAILAVDGERFTYLSVRNQQAYSGPLTAKVLSRYAPDGLATSMSYYWLLGRIPPGSVGLGAVGLDPDGQGYWLDLYYSSTGSRSKILFNPDQHLVKRHLVLSGHDSIAVDLAYEYPHPRQTVAGTKQSQSVSPAAVCQMPARITISKTGNGHMSLGFNKRYPTPSLDSSQFSVSPPAEYKRISVQ